MAGNDIKEARRDNVIEAALKVFAEKGFSDATMADIAKEAGVSTPVLYEYFKTKEDLLFSIPEKFNEEPLHVMNFVAPYLRGAEAKIRGIVQGTISQYESNPLYASLVMLELKTNRNFLKTKAYDNIRKMSHMLLASIQEGIDDGTFKENTDAFLIRSMITGTIDYLCTRKLLLGEPKNLSIYIDPIVDTILEGIKKQTRRFSINLSMIDLEMADSTGNTKKEKKQLLKKKTP